MVLFIVAGVLVVVFFVRTSMLRSKKKGPSDF